MRIEVGVSSLMIDGPAEPDGLPSMPDVERALIVTSVRRWPGRKREIAEALGICLATLYNRLDQYGLDTDGEPLGGEGNGIAADYREGTAGGSGGGAAVLVAG